MIAALLLKDCNMKKRTLGLLGLGIGLIGMGQVWAQPSPTPASSATALPGVSPLQTSQVFEPFSGLSLHVGKQAATRGSAMGDVLYVHGATFGSDLSVFFRFDGQSWADVLNAAGYTVWGFDFSGFGRSERPLGIDQKPIGRADSAALQIAAVVDSIRSQNGGKPIYLVAHSWGTIPAAKFAIQSPEKVGKLVMFAPIVQRHMSLTVPSLGPTRLLSVWEQYRRFIEDVPKGQPPLLQDRYIQAWASAYLAQDPSSAARQPPSLTTPNGPLVDIMTQWSGTALYEPAKLRTSVLLVRGEWDSLCTDQDATAWLAATGSTSKREVKIPHATHLMHLENGRTALYQAVNDFLGTP